MSERFEQLRRAVVAFETLRSPGRIAAAIKAGGLDALDAAFVQQSPADQAAIERKAGSLFDDGVFALVAGDPDFPRSLTVRGIGSIPILFGRGNRDLVHRPSVGFCGSRNVSALGLEAVTRCTEAMVERDLTIVSGYAKGVDAAAHLAALRAGGTTVFALPEGIDGFRVKREYTAVFSETRTLVLSQFTPGQPWQAHAAMARNAIIFGLTNALVVIEAGEKGGTLAAGRGALKLGRPVLAVDFGESTPVGNRLLMAEGAVPIRTPAALHRALDSIADAESGTRGLFEL